MLKELRYSLLIAIFLFVSCDVSDSDEFRDTFSYQISEQSVIKTDTRQQSTGPDSSVSVLFFDVVAGDSTVFRYEHNVIAPPNIVDGGFFETLIFQIPSGANRFEFRNEELVQAKTLYGQSSSFQFFVNPVANGLIRGERLSPLHWIVRADVTVETLVDTFQVEFEEPFFVE